MPCTTYAEECPNSTKDPNGWKRWKYKNDVEYREKTDKRNIEWTRNNMDKHHKYQRKYRQKIKRKAFEVYSNPPKCKNCGILDIDVLTLDHINEDGNIQRKDLPVSTQFYKYIIDNKPQDIQVLCFNCNVKKHLNGGKL